jgi:hypothetical protein
MIDLSENSAWWERFALIALLAALLWMGPANIWDKQIDHGYPYGFYAQDAFIFMSYQYYLEESGSWHYLAPYLSRGHTDVIQTQLSVLEVLSVLIAQATGLGFPAAIYVTVMLLVFLAVFCFYFIVRSFNPKVALLSLPLNVLLFAPVFITAFTWGNWPFFAGSSMLVLFFWCLARIKERFIPALGALAMAAVAFGHTSEYIFIVPLLGFLFLVDIASRAFNWKEWMRIAGMAIASALIASYYLVIFKGTFMHFYTPQNLVPDVQGLSQFVSVTTLGTWLAIVIGAGVLVGLLMLRKHRVIQIGLVFLLLGFTNYIGSSKRGLETRYMWPIYLSVFVGILIYFLLTNVLKQKLSTRTCAIIGMVLTVLLANQFYFKLDGPGLLFQEGWNGIEWINQQTPKNATVLYVYGDSYSNQGAVLFNSQRISDFILIDDYAQMVQASQLRRTVQTEQLFDRTNDLPYRTGLLSFDFYYKKDGNLKARGPVDFCSFDYYFLDKVSRSPPAAQFNIIVAQHLLNKANFTNAYENQGVIILNNPRPGGDCLVE